MANIEKTVQVIYAGTDDISKTMATITGSLDRFASRTRNVTQPLADLAVGVLKTEGALAALGAGGLAYAYAKSIAFEGATIELKKVIGDEVELLDQAREHSLELSNQYGVTASNVLSSTAAFKQAGFSVKDSMILTKDAIDLVMASELEAAGASEILISTLKGFDAPASEARRLLDILNEVSAKYATNVEQLGLGMAKLSPIAKTMGFSFEETAGILTPVIEVFRSGDEAATALKTGLLRLVDDKKAVEAALLSIGVAQRDTNGSLRSGKDILYDVAKAFTHLDENQKLFVTQQLVGINQSAKMVQVFDNLHKSTEITSVAMNSAGSAAKEVAEQLKSGEVAVERFKVGFENMATVIGDRFRASATNAINGATDIENTLQDLAESGAFDDLLNTVGGMADEIGTLFEGIAKAMPEALQQVDWSGFTESLRDVINEVGDLFDAMFGDVDLTTPEGLATAIQKVIDAGTALNHVVSGLLDAWEPFIRGFSKGIDSFSQGGADVQEFVGKILGMGLAINKIADQMGPLTSALNSLSGAFMALAGVQAGKTLISFGKAALNIPGKLSGANASITTLGKGLVFLKGLGAIGVAVTIGLVGAEALYKLFPGLKEEDQRTFQWTGDILVKMKKGVFDKPGQIFADWVADLIIGPKVEIDPGALQREWDAMNLEMTAYIETLTDFGPIQGDWNALNFDAQAYVKTITDFDAVQADWDAIVSEIENSDIKMPEVETNFDAIQDEWDAITDEIERSDIRMRVKVDSDELNNAKKRIKGTFSKAEMGPVGLELDAGPGVKGIYDQIASQFKDHPIPMENVFDPSALSSLFKELDTQDLMKRLMVERAIKQQLEIQREMANINKAAAQRMWDAAYLMKSTSESDEGGTIEVSGKGLEPEMEAFMWKLLKKIQVRANKSGAEFLLAART